MAHAGLDGRRGRGAIAAAVLAGSVALLGFGLDSGIEAMASVIVIWRFTGTRLASATSERRAQRPVAVSFFLLAPYIAVERPGPCRPVTGADTSIAELILTAGTAIFEPTLGSSSPPSGWPGGGSAPGSAPRPPPGGTQVLLCAYLAMAVFAGLAANTLSGAW